MDAGETLRMSRKEAPREGLLKAALAGKVTNAEVAAALQLTVRQVQRLKRRYETAGAAGLLHRLRGQPSPRRLAPALRAQVATLLRTRYHDVNDCHAHEQLQQVEGLALSRRSLQRLRRALGVPSKHRRRPRVYHARRLREARAGALVQVDASSYAWLEDRGPALALHGAIDDATGEVLALHFRPTEDLHGYVCVLQQLATTHGLPLALYGDRLNVFVRNDPHWTLAEQLAGAQRPTHFGQMLQGLGIGFIVAGSPQAKGRVERLWQTLQDRLVVELRWAGITTAAGANAFVPTFLAGLTARFAHPARDPQPAWRRGPRDLALHLSCRYPRVVARDNTVRLGLRWVQLPPRPRYRSWAGCRVELRELCDGRLVVLHAARVIATHPAPTAAFVLKPRRSPHRARSASPSAAPARRPPGPPPAEGAPGGYRATPRKSPPRPRQARWSSASRPSLSHPWRTGGPATRRSRTTTSPRG